MNRTFIILLFLCKISFAQIVDRIEWSLPIEEDLNPENLVSKYNQFDFSNIWTTTANYYVLGIIGNEHQRIKIKLVSVNKNLNNPNQYFVTGKSCVKGTICDFSGTINLTEIKRLKELQYGVDNEYLDKGIKSQGILIAEYEFKENEEQKHSGFFKGKLHSKWYLTSDNRIKYDNIDSISDGYLNNAYVGIWISHSTGKEKICNWADYRVPQHNRDFDVGAGEFSPSDDYYDKRWENYKNAWLNGNENAKKIELEEWWK